MASTELVVADDLALPLDTITETLLIIAMRGSGKTHTATVLVEEMITAGLPVAVIDPTGVWWGLRSSIDGTGPGLPITILGGLHADLSLDHTSGAVIAEFLVTEQIPLLLDLSEMSKTQMRRFATDFLERLYHLKNQHREPLHLVVDEADLLAPMTAGKDTMRLLGAYDDIARRGRARGLGLTSITQRPAKLHTDVRSQAQVLVALRLTGTHDIAAIDVWVSAHATTEEAREVKASLPSMPVGTAWVWSPGWLGILQKIVIRQRRTFDSSATPKVGQTLTAPRSFASVDLGALQARMATVIEKAAADDPKALRKQIADLQRMLRTASPVVAAENADLRRQLAEALAREPERVEVPAVAPGDVAALEQAITGLRDIAGSLEIALSRAAAPAPSRPAPARPAPAAAVPQPRPRPAPAPGDGPAEGGAPLSKAQRAVLTVLAQYGERTKRQLAMLTGYSAKGGGFNNSLSSLRTSGLIERGEPVRITPEGIDALGDWEPLPEGAALVDHWMGQLSKAAASALRVLLDAYPASLTKTQIAEQAGYSADGGGFNNALSRLRTLQLIDGYGSISADETLASALEGSNRG